MNLQTLKYKKLKNGRRIQLTGNRTWHKDEQTGLNLIPAHFEYSEGSTFIQGYINRYQPLKVAA